MLKDIYWASTQAVLHTLQHHIFLTNHSKSRLTPENKLQGLAIQWNTAQAVISLPVEKKDWLSGKLSTPSSIISHSKGVGGHGGNPVCIHSRPDRESHSRMYQLVLYLTSQERQERRASSVSIVSLECSQQMDWSRSHDTLRSLPPFQNLFENSHNGSHNGWGVHSSRGNQLQGWWSPLLWNCNTNTLEMVTIYLALNSFTIPRKSHIHLHSDNMTTVYCINCQVLAKSHILNSLFLFILHL